MKKVKVWLKENGFVGATTLIISILGLVLGMKLVFAGFLGFFLGKNWEIIRKLWKEEYKEKLLDAIEDVKDDMKK